MPLPASLHATFVTGSQPYGNLENLLRRSLARSGVAVVAERGKASAVLTILRESSERRVRAVNADGRPAEYALDYRVRYQLLGDDGAVLLAPQSLHLSRDYAYSPTVELGVGREQSAILAELQADAARLILLRLEALGRSIPAPAAASGGTR
ncbi:MAG TPA: LPS assembly lipoprotein LptE [Gammaproteobacteria bacterium]|nr:LPS assembly lipoprotein LptE [Gammaproteobacteria bacterium]